MFEARVGSLRGLVVGEGLRVSRSKNGETVVNKRLSRLVEFMSRLGNTFLLHSRMAYTQCSTNVVGASYSISGCGNDNVLCFCSKKGKERKARERKDGGTPLN